MKPSRKALPVFLIAVIGWVVATAAAAQNATPSLDVADTAMKGGRFADAAREYEALLKKHPAAKAVLFALGVCYSQMGKRAEAARALTQYLDLVPDSADGHALLGITLLDGARTSDAKVQLNEALRLNPNQIDALKALARIFMVEGDAARAISLLRPLADSPSAEEEVRLLLANARLRSGDAAGAAAGLDGLLAATPRSTVAAYVLAAQSRIKLADLSRAAEICEQGMRLYPNAEAIEAVYMSLPPQFLAQRLASRIEGVQNAPNVDELVALGRVLSDGDPARKTRALEIARSLLDRAVDLAPGNASAHYNYGRALKRDNPDLMLAEWEKALSLNADAELKIEIYTQIAKWKDSVSDLSGAERSFRAALEANLKLPVHRPEAAIEYVHFLVLQSRQEEAKTLLDLVLSWNPLFPQAHMERGRLLAGRGQWGQAIREGEFVIRNAGDNQALLRIAHLLLARAYRATGQLKKAQEHKAWVEGQ